MTGKEVISFSPVLLYELILIEVEMSDFLKVYFVRL